MIKWRKIQDEGEQHANNIKNVRKNMHDINVF
jgi:hypothetical protein